MIIVLIIIVVWAVRFTHTLVKTLDFVANF